MPTTFEALDNEFAVATGSNVNSSPGRSDFDYPPTSSMNLVVTAKPGDPQPGRFEVGETYEVSYNGPGGAHTLTDAVVIRSDLAGPDGGVVVFEGTSGGETQQVVWSPNFDLETWYFDNFSGGNPPEFYTTDQQAATFEFVCFAPDTGILTPAGSRPAGQLVPGDIVVTLDHGPQPLIWTGARELTFPPSPDSQKPVLLRHGCFARDLPARDLVLSPQHRILAKSPDFSVCGVDGTALVKSKSLRPIGGVRIMGGKRRMTYVSLLFARHEIIFAEGVAVESFYPGRFALSLLTARERAEIAAALPVAGHDPCAIIGPLARPETKHRQAMRLASQGRLSFPRYCCGPVKGAWQKGALQSTCSAMDPFSSL